MGNYVKGGTFDSFIVSAFMPILKEKMMPHNDPSDPKFSGLMTRLTPHEFLSSDCSTRLKSDSCL